MKRIIKLVVIAISVFSLLSVSSCKWNSRRVEKKDALKIGVILPLTGNTAIIGEWHKQGIELAAKEINKNDTIIELIYQDSKNTGKDAITAYNYLLAQDVDVVFSAMSNVSIPLLPLSKRDKIPLFVTSVSYPGFASQSKFVFRYNITSDNEAELAAKEMSKNSVREMNIFYINDQYGFGALKSYEKTADSLNINIIGNESFEVSQTDFKNTIAKLNTSIPTYVAGYGRSYVTLLTNLINVSTVDTLYSVYGIDFPEFVAPLPKTGKTFGYTRPKRIKNMRHELFMEDFIKQYDKNPNLVSVFSYDLINLIYNISKESDSFSIEQIKNKTFGNSIYGYDMNVNQHGEIDVPLEFVYLTLDY